MIKLPFVPGIFFKTLIVVVAMVALIWTLALWIMEYEVSTADYVGTFITTILATYLFHLWVIPVDDLPFDESDSIDGDDEDGEDVSRDGT